MRALHVADLHMGHTLNGWTRETEHAVYFSRLLEVIEEEQVDLLLIPGDIFDNTNPSSESQRMLYDFFRAAVAARPLMKIIATSGNHDPSGRLEAPGEILSLLNIHLVGTTRRIDGILDADRHLVKVTDAEGVPVALVCAIPFLRAADLPGLSFAAANLENGSPVVSATRAFMNEIGAAAEAAADGLPIIAMAHLHVRGATESEGAERTILIGGEHAVPADVFPACFTHICLGHLHHPQGGANYRYSGSCFPLSASEIGCDHGVSILEIGPDGVTTRHRSIPWPAQVLRVPANPADGLEGLARELEELEVDTDMVAGLRPLVYVLIEEEGPAAVAMAEAERIVAEYPVRLADLRIRRAQVRAAAERRTTRSLADTSPERLFISAFIETSGTEPSEMHLAAYRDLAAEV